jgi:5-methylcytosine-specific restriction endonuclease McrA
MTDADRHLRKLAIEAGQGRYFPSVLCKHGHDEGRFVSNNTCYGCTKAWNARNPEKMRDAVLQWNARNPDRVAKNRLAWCEANKDRWYESIRRWKLENKSHIVEINKIYRKKTKPAQAAYRESWRQKNREQTRAYCRNRRSLRKNAVGFHCSRDIERIFLLQKYTCAYCKKKLRGELFHVDHIVAISRGGSNWPRNLQILCPACNCSKNAKDPIDFAREIGRLL